MNLLRTKNLLLSWTFFALVCGSTATYGQGPLYTEGPGINPPFDDIRDDIANGYAGTTIDVNNAAVEGGIFGSLGIEDDLRLHTLANSSLPESSFGNWSRWYQEDGATQIFRLFPGEENVRNSRPLAARIEAFDTNTGWNVADGQWHEWAARYTIIKPINAAIFQAKDQDDEAWSVHINMSSSGKVSLTHRRPLEGQPKTETLIENAIGQPFDIRIRDNGLDYEVYFGSQSQPFTTGQFVRNADPGDNSDTRFRWGIYVGATEVLSEALIFVSHASVNPDIEYPTDPPVVPGTLIAGWDTWNSTTAPISTATAPGVTATATASSGGGNWGNTDSGADPGRGSSKGMTWGSFDGSGDTASSATNEGPANLSLTNGNTDGELTFTIINGGTGDLDLNSFHMDALAFRPNAARTYALNVLSGDLTIGNVFTSAAPLNDNSTNAITQLGGNLLTNDLDPLTHDQHDDIDIDMSGLADHTLAAGESAVIQIAFSNGTGSGGGHHLFLDNVAFSGTVEGTTVLLGDVDLDGVVDFLDISPFISVLSGTTFQAEADIDQSGTVDFLDISPFIAILSGS